MYMWRACWLSRLSVGLWIWRSRVRFPASVLRVLSLGKIIYLHFLTLPSCKWVPVLLGKFPATDWRPVLGVVRATCQPNVTEIGDWLRSYGPYGPKRQTLTCICPNPQYGQGDSLTDIHWFQPNTHFLKLRLDF